MSIFKETVFYNCNNMNDDLIYVSSCGILLPDANYVIARENSKTTVFAYVLSGDAYIGYNDRLEKIKKGDCYLFPSHTNNKIETDLLNPHSMLWINCRGRLLDELVRSYFDISLPIIAMYSIENEFKKISSLIQTPAKERVTDEIAQLIFKIILDMKRSLHKTEMTSPAAASPIEDQIESYIGNHIQEKFCVNNLCDAFRLSDRQLELIFKKRFGCTPYTYYLSKKIELATAMLKDSNLPIAAIAERLNFADRNHFTKVFISKTGMSPAKFRREVSISHFPK